MKATVTISIEEYLRYKSLNDKNKELSNLLRKEVKEMDDHSKLVSELKKLESELKEIKTKWWYKFFVK